jgi:glucoamylase
MTPLASETAPGWPGIAPRWTSSAKEGVETSASYQSRVWFTISHGILNEIYYPRIDQAQASPGGLLPEQVWDAEDIPKRGLHNGRPAGSAMALVWAHAEYIKLARSIRERKVFDMPPQPIIRYQNKETTSKLVAWRLNQKIRTIPIGRNLRVEVLAAAIIHWSGDDWKTITDSKTVDTGLGIHYADLEAAGLSPGDSVVFTFFWSDANKWEGTDFQIAVAERALTTIRAEW